MSNFAAALLSFLPSLFLGLMFSVPAILLFTGFLAIRKQLAKNKIVFQAVAYALQFAAAFTVAILIGGALNTAYTVKWTIALYMLLSVLKILLYHCRFKDKLLITAPVILALDIITISILSY